MNILIATILIFSSFFGGNIYKERQNEKALSVLKQDISKAQQSVLDVKSTLLQNLGSQLAVAGETYYLSGSGVSATQSTINLTKFGYTKPDATYQKFTMTNFGSLGCGTIQPGNQSGKQEFVSFTGITQNTDGSAQLTGVIRGLERFSPYSASTTLQATHYGSASFVVSNSPPCFYENYVTINNAETISSTKTFVSTKAPKYDVQYTASGNEFVSYNQLNATAIAGAGTSTQISFCLIHITTKAQAAAGTASSTSGAPLVLTTRDFGNTYHFASTSMAVMTGLTGTLDHNLIATSSTDNYNFAGAISIASSSPQSIGLTVGATTTTANLAVASSTISINGVTMRFPSTQGASTTVLANNGSGGLTWNGFDWQQLGEQVLTSANSTSTVTFAARKDLLITFDSPGASGNAVTVLTFNTDGYGGSGTSYYFNAFKNYVSTSGSLGVSGAEIMDTGTSSPVNFEVTMRNSASTRKRFNFIKTSGAVNNDVFSGMGMWNNTTDQVTTVSIFTQSAAVTWNAGTRLTVYGSKD